MDNKDLYRVAVSGFFDPLTIAHIRYFKEASKLGDLIVILNGDKAAIRKKGYVFMPLKERKEIIFPFLTSKKLPARVGSFFVFMLIYTDVYMEWNIWRREL